MHRFILITWNDVSSSLPPVHECKWLNNALNAQSWLSLHPFSFCHHHHTEGQSCGNNPAVWQRTLYCLVAIILFFFHSFIIFQSQTRFCHTLCIILIQRLAWKWIFALYFGEKLQSCLLFPLVLFHEIMFTSLLQLGLGKVLGFQPHCMILGLKLLCQASVCEWRLSDVSSQLDGGPSFREVHVGWPRCGLLTWQHQHTRHCSKSGCKGLLGLLSSFSVGKMLEGSNVKGTLVTFLYPIPAHNEQCQSQYNDSCRCWISASWCQWFRKCMTCIGLCVVTSFNIPAAKMTLKAVLYLYVSYF